MKVRLRRLSPIQAGVVAGAMYGLLGILFALFSLLILAGTRATSSSVPSAAGILMIFVPFIYAALGFIGASLMAWLYNLVAGWVGGVELQLETSGKELAD